MKKDIYIFEIYIHIFELYLTSIGLVAFNTLYSVTVTAQFIDSNLKYMFCIWRESTVKQY